PDRHPRARPEDTAISPRLPGESFWVVGSGPTMTSGVKVGKREGTEPARRYQFREKGIQLWRPQSSAGRWTPRGWNPGAQEKTRWSPVLIRIFTATPGTSNAPGVSRESVDRRYLFAQPVLAGEFL